MKQIKWETELHNSFVKFSKSNRKHNFNNKSKRNILLIHVFLGILCMLNSLYIIYNCNEIIFEIHYIKTFKNIQILLSILLLITNYFLSVNKIVYEIFTKTIISFLSIFMTYINLYNNILNGLYSNYYKYISYFCISWQLYRFISSLPFLFRSEINLISRFIFFVIVIISDTTLIFPWYTIINPYLISNLELYFKSFNIKMEIISQNFYIEIILLSSLFSSVFFKMKACKKTYIIAAFVPIISLMLTFTIPYLTGYMSIKQNILLMIFGTPNLPFSFL